MSVSAVAPTPFYQDPDRLQIGLPQTRAEETKAAAKEGKNLSMFAEGDDEPSFWDLLDVINPLQHIPLVNDIYQELTGDKIGVGARLLGGTLFGGPIGLAAAVTNAVVEESTGKDVGGHMIALFKDDKPSDPIAPDAPASQFAAAEPSASAAPQQSAAAPAQAVSSSPAKAEVAADAAPVIGLPDSAPAKAAAAPTMMFSLEGALPAAAPQAPVTQAPLAQPAQVAAATQPGQANGAPLALNGKPARVMPVPNRTTASPAPLPPISVPVSNGSSRSNVPITGRSPTANSAPSAAAVQRALAGQEVPADHPMLPPTNEAGAQTAAGPDWFTAAWGQALDKYQRANQMNGKTAPTTTTLQ